MLLGEVVCAAGSAAPPRLSMQLRSGRVLERNKRNRSSSTLERLAEAPECTDDSSDDDCHNRNTSGIAWAPRATRRGIPAPPSAEEPSDAFLAPLPIARSGASGEYGRRLPAHLHLNRLLTASSAS